MGFLDSLLSTAVQRATGVNAKRLIRRLGAGKILMAGGAALAGGLAMERMNRGKTSTATGGGATPSLPPTPGSVSAATAELPPLPDLADAEPVAEDLPRGLHFAIVRTMVAAAWADGVLDAEERKLIREQMTESSLTARQVEQVNRDLMVPVSPEELADIPSNPAEAAALLRAAILVVRADGLEAGVEHVWLERLAGALGIDAQEREAIADDLDAALRAPLPPIPG